MPDANAFGRWADLGSAQRWFIALTPPFITVAAGAVDRATNLGLLYAAAGLLVAALTLFFLLDSAWSRLKGRLKRRSGLLALPEQAARAPLRPDRPVPSPFSTWKGGLLAAIRRSAFNGPALPFFAGAFSAGSLCVIGAVGLYADASPTLGLALGAGIANALIMTGAFYSWRR